MGERERDDRTRPGSRWLLTTHLQFPRRFWRRLPYQGVIVTQKNEYRTLLDEAEMLMADATNKAIRDRVELRDAVCSYLTAEQGRGSSIESVRSSVEAIFIRAEVRVGKLNGHKELAKDLVDWCLGRQARNDGNGSTST